MSFFTKLLITTGVLAVSGASSFVGARELLGDMRPGGVYEKREVPYTVRLRGRELIATAQSLLESDITTFETNRSVMASRRLFNEVPASFTRAAGQALAQGSLRDGSAPRLLKLVIDGYDDTGAYLDSGVVQVISQVGSTPYTVVMRDRPDIGRFSFRVLDAQNEEIRIADQTAAARSRTPVTLRMGLMPADGIELLKIYKSLGYVEEESSPELSVLSGVVRRFRRDHGVTSDAPPLLLDLYMARAVDNSIPAQPGIVGYYASWIEGMRRTPPPRRVPFRSAPKAPSEERARFGDDDSRPARKPVRPTAPVDEDQVEFDQPAAPVMGVG